MVNEKGRPLEIFSPRESGEASNTKRFTSMNTTLPEKLERNLILVHHRQQRKTSPDLEGVDPLESPHETDSDGLSHLSLSP